MEEVALYVSERLKRSSDYHSKKISKGTIPKTHEESITINCFRFILWISGWGRAVVSVENLENPSVQTKLFANSAECFGDEVPEIFPVRSAPSGKPEQKIRITPPYTKPWVKLHTHCIAVGCGCSTLFIYLLRFALH